MTVLFVSFKKYSSKHYHANQKILAYQKEIKNALPVELQETLVYKVTVLFVCSLLK
jgi:hypothetical protein